METIVKTGRRKEATASVRLTPGTGNITINGRQFVEYFPREVLRLHALEPLKVASAEAKYDIAARISGGGSTGQAGALRHAIARALIESSPELRAALKKGGFLTRDPRMKERKKYGQKGARKRFQFSKR